MNRLNKPISDDSCDFPKDIKILRDSIPELSRFNGLEVEKFYRGFRGDIYGFDWVLANEERIEEFRVWLHEEV